MRTRLFREVIALVLLAALPAAVSGYVQLEWRGSPQAELQADEVRPGTARMWGHPVLWVDARSRERFNAGHVEGAILLNEEHWEELIPAFLDAWDPEKTIVVYCDGGKCDASRAVANRLRDELKLESVYVLQGGWTAWRENERKRARTK
jgi:rhodanese-related sulfurtransferase